MAGYFPDRARILPCSQEPAATSYLSQTQPVCTLPISIRTILISPSHLRLRLSSSFLTSAYQPRKFDTKPVRIRSKFMLYLYKCELLLEDMNNNFGTTIVPYNALSKYRKICRRIKLQFFFLALYGCDVFGISIWGQACLWTWWLKYQATDQITHCRLPYIDSVDYKKYETARTWYARGEIRTGFITLM